MQKVIEVEGIGEVTLARRKGTRSIRLSISSGKVRLGLPFGVSEAAALKFIQQKRDWILKHAEQEPLLKSGDRIGRAHKLFFEPFETTKISARILEQTIFIRYPRNNKSYEDEVQKAAIRGSKKALLKEAEKLLPFRLRDISNKIGIDYKSLDVKFLKSRWGSCTSKKEITLNAYLIQLDWALIDYVIIHELAHTVHQNHGDRFWSLVSEHCPQHKEFRKALKSKPTAILPNSFEMKA